MVPTKPGEASGPEKKNRSGARDPDAFRLRYREGRAWHCFARRERRSANDGIAPKRKTVKLHGKRGDWRGRCLGGTVAFTNRELWRASVSRVIFGGIPGRPLHPQDATIVLNVKTGGFRDPCDRPGR